MESDMSVTSISGAVTEIGMKSIAPAVASVHPAKEASTSNSEAAIQAAQVAEANAATVNKVAPLAKQAAQEKDKSKDDTAQHMSHVVEVYNTQGKKRLKFMDNRNNVIYQVPSEAVAKMEDLMMKPDASTSQNG
jgi:hypothetical protein